MTWAPEPPAPLTSTPYAPNAWNQLHFAGFAGLGQGAFDKLQPRAVQNAAIEPGQFGLVMWEPGLGFAAPQYQAIAESVASAGFVVAAVTPTHSANLTVLDDETVGPTPVGDPPDLGSHHGTAVTEADHLIQVWAHDATTVAAELHAGTAGRLLNGHLRGGTMYAGHSFGGAAALQACADDTTCHGAADLDGTQFGPVLNTGVDHPLLLLGSEDSCITGTCGAKADPDPEDLTAARSLLQHSRGPAHCFTMTGAHHFNFTDYGAYYLAAPLAKFLALGSIDRQRALTITSALVAGFALSGLEGNPRNLREPDGFAHPDSYPELVTEPCHS